MRNNRFSGLLANVRKKHPLVHHITNYVTVNDCANVTIAVGAAPVMADAPEEVCEMVALSQALVLNIGTPGREQSESMLLAGGTANDLHIPVVLDPVGAGATTFRTSTALHLLDEIRISILKGNPGEIGTLGGAEATVRGVDSGGISGDSVTVARNLAREWKTTVAMTGPTDIVTDGRRVFFIENGHPLLGSISGTGCMAASLTAAFAAVSNDPAAASAAALAALGISGEKAAQRTSGPYSFKVALIDELAGLTPEDMAASARIRTQPIRS